MVLPENAVVLQEEEMRYVEGGKSWSKKITVKTAKHKYQYKVTIKDLKAFQYQALETAGLASVFVGSCAASPSGGAIAVAIGSAVALGVSVNKLISMVNVKKVKTYY